MRSLLIGYLGLIAAAAPSLAQTEALVPAIKPVGVAGKNKVVWLLLKGGPTDRPAFFAIPTASQEECEMSGAEYMASKRINQHQLLKGMECLEGIR